MNERIKQLALQAMTYVTHNPKANKLNSGDMFDEKFAELIVKECAEFARQHNLEKADRSHMIHKAIKQHFGVEE